MAEAILVYGKSGAGKSRALKNFGEDEILFVNVISKRLPFQKKFTYELKTTDYNHIKSKLQKMLEQY
jgi:RNase adaptor protein for sRNA GlmZ degradation